MQHAQPLGRCMNEIVEELRIGDQAIWTLEVKGQHPVTWLVKLIDHRQNFGRRDWLIESNTGGRLWVMERSLRAFKRPASQTPSQSDKPN